MYICSVCGKKLKDPQQVEKHFLRCWQEHNPNHQSKEAPQSENIEERKVSESVLNFFANLQKE